MEQQRILLIDTDAGFLNSLTKETRKESSICTASNSNEAQRIILNKTIPLLGVVISDSLGLYDFHKLIQFKHQYRPDIPILVLTGGNSRFSEEKCLELGITQVLRKPVTLAKLMSELKIAVTTPKTTDKFEEIIEDDAKFYPVSTQGFLRGKKCPFDVLIKIGEHKYVKVLKAYDILDITRVKDFQAKGLKHFYLSRDAQTAFIEFCKEMAIDAMSHPRVGLTVRLEQAGLYADQTMGYLKTFGLTEKGLSYAKDSATQVTELVKAVAHIDTPEVHAFLNNAIAFEHGVGTMLIATLLGKTQALMFDKNLETVGMAALLHDIGLYTLPSQVHSEDESKLSDELLEIYKTHPRVGSEMLRKMGKIPEVVTQAVWQHHERTTGKGFPSQTVKGSINKIAEVVGISDEFLRFIKSETMKSKNPKEKAIALNRILEGFSDPVVESFKAIFVSNAR